MSGSVADPVRSSRVFPGCSVTVLAAGCASGGGLTALECGATLYLSSCFSCVDYSFSIDIPVLKISPPGTRYAHQALFTISYFNQSPSSLPHPFHFGPTRTGHLLKLSFWFFWDLSVFTWLFIQGAAFLKMYQWDTSHKQGPSVSLAAARVFLCERWWSCFTSTAHTKSFIVRVSTHFTRAVRKEPVVERKAADFVVFCFVFKIRHSLSY